ALAHQLALEGEREAAGARLEQDALAVHRLAALETAGQVDTHHVPPLDLRAVLHRAELGDRFPELADGALDVLVAPARRGPRALEAAPAAARDRGARRPRGR